MLESQLNTLLASFGVICDIDTQRLFDELQDEAKGGVTHRSTQKPTTFEDATTIDECIDALTRAAISAGGITCADADPYVKCMVRVMELHKQSLSDSDIAQFDEQVESELRKQNVNCQLNVREMINDLRHIPAMEIGSSEFMQCARENSATAESLSCEDLEATLRCLMQMEDAYKTLNNRQRDSLQQVITQGFPDCQISLAAIQSELKGNGAEGIRAPVIFSMAVILVYLLLGKRF